MHSAVINVNPGTLRHTLSCSEPFELKPVNRGGLVAITCSLTAKGFLHHPEHGTIVLDPGKHVFSVVPEYDPWMATLVPVFD